MNRLQIFVIALLATAHSSCLSLNSFLYDAKALDEYTLPYGPNWPAMYRIPEELRSVREVHGSDGTVTWLVYAPQSATTSQSAPTVIYHHGQSDNIDPYWERASLIWALGANVVIYDYPSYGKTPGTPSEQTVYATARAALEFVHGLGDQIDQSRIFHYGFSLGSGPATQMAATTGPTRGLILESAFTSIDALVADGALVVPHSFLINNSFNNRAKIRAAAINAPLGVLLFHGTSDTYVQTAYSRQLDQEIIDGETAGTVPLNRHQLVLIEGADHSEVPCIPPGDSPCNPRPMDGPYASTLRAFLMY